ncbi:MAG: GNAT family N-acetyltransferase, partial [Anaerolineales bacterium]
MAAPFALVIAHSLNLSVAAISSFSEARVRHPDERDRPILARWLAEGVYVHRHLDWRPPLDWLGHPFWWTLEKERDLVAVLACPDDPPEIAWLRLFAYSSSLSFSWAWRVLWEQARDALAKTKPMVGAIATEYWLEPLLQRARFEMRQRVVVLEWRAQAAFPSEGDWPVRAMRPEDLPAVAQVDWQAFVPPWRHSLESLRYAFSQALFATVLEIEGKILGYQITTGHPFGAHLARLAIHPQVQGKGWGKKLLQHLFALLAQRRIERLTVNTQHDNRVSLALYRRLGFERTGEEFP